MLVLAAPSLRGSRLLCAALPVFRALDAGGGRVALGVLWRDQICYLYHGDPRRPLEAGIGGHELYPADQSSIGAVLRAAQAPASDGAAAAVRVQGHALLRAGRGNASLAVPVATPAIAGLALFGTGVDSARAGAGSDARQGRGADRRRLRRKTMSQTRTGDGRWRLAA